jgi:hypothetical protein
VPREIVLRSGDAVAFLANDGPERPSAPLRDDPALAKIEPQPKEAN